MSGAACGVLALGPFARLSREDVEHIAECAVAALGVPPWDVLSPGDVESAVSARADDLREARDDAREARKSALQRAEVALRYENAGHRVVNAIADLLADPVSSPGARRALELVAAERGLGCAANAAGALAALPAAPAPGSKP